MVFGSNNNNNVEIFLNAFCVETSVKQITVYLYKDNVCILERSPDTVNQALVWKIKLKNI